MILEEVCARMQHNSSLAYMGFTIDFGSGLPHGITLEHDLVKDEDDRSDRAMGTWLSCTLHRIGSMMSHFASWVGLFGLAASDDDQDVCNCISRLRAHYRSSLNATSFQKKNKFLNQLVMSSPFSAVLMREIEDVVVSPDILPKDWKLQRIKDYARSIFSSWGQTKIVEDNFKYERPRGLRHKEQIPSAVSLLGDGQRYECHRGASQGGGDNTRSRCNQ